MSTLELRHHLQTLNAERAAAALAGLDGNALYMHDLDAEIRAMRNAYVGAVVTDIASLRGEVGGPLLG